MKRVRFGLLPRIIVAIILGVLLGNVLTMPWVRVFVTFNALFSQLLGFLVPLIIIGLVTPAIADTGSVVACDGCYCICGYCVCWTLVLWDRFLAISGYGRVYLCGAGNETGGYFSLFYG